MDFFKENSHLSDEAVALYVDALKLDKLGQMPESILEHVSECAECKSEVEDLFLLLEDQPFGQKGQHPFFRSDPALGRRNLSLIYRIAAVLFVALGIYSGYRLIVHRDRATSSPADSKMLEIEVDSAKQEPITEMMANNFAPLPSLEDLTKTQYRSGEIEIQSPRLNEEVGKSVNFKWIHKPGKTLILKIFNNRGEEIHTARTNSNSYIYGASLKPGLYYWKLANEEELFIVGKFLKR